MANNNNEVWTFPSHFNKDFEEVLNSEFGIDDTGQVHCHIESKGKKFSKVNKPRETNKVEKVKNTV